MSRRPPKFEALVVNAIRRLQAAQGSTASEIANYLNREYDVGGPDIKRHIQLTIKRGINYGIIQKSKRGYITCDRNVPDVLDDAEMVDCRICSGYGRQSRRRGKSSRRSRRGGSSRRSRKRKSRRSRSRSGGRRRRMDGDRKVKSRTARARVRTARERMHRVRKATRRMAENNAPKENNKLKKNPNPPQNNNTGEPTPQQNTPGSRQQNQPVQNRTRSNSGSPMRRHASQEPKPGDGRET